ncbi:MAG: hypothetical protein M3336_04385 [Chloroflexota bacterium]|nr:hypothetical protein [Chloroflexota bacterium]
MVSTVTTTTVTVITALDLSVLLGGVGAVVLILLLVEYELASAAGPRLRPLTRILSVAIAPLLVAFVAIWASRVAALLQGL